MKLAERKQCMDLYTDWMKKHGYDAEEVRIKLLLLDAYGTGWGAALAWVKELEADRSSAIGRMKDAQRDVARLERERDTAQAQVKELEVRAAAMRELLIDTPGEISCIRAMTVFSPASSDERLDAIFHTINRALSLTSGSVLLAELRALREVAQAARALQEGAYPVCVGKNLTSYDYKLSDWQHLSDALDKQAAPDSELAEPQPEAQPME